MPATAAIAERLAALLGPQGWLTGADCAPYQRDWLNRYGELPLGVARPARTDEVSAVMAICHAAGLQVVPQGGNTGLCGAAVLGQPGGVILSLARMGHIGAPDLTSGSIEVGAGVVLAQLHRTLEGSGMMVPLHLGAEGSARIGGLIGTNAGGSHAFRYGMMVDLVLGLEVVLSDGTVWNGLRSVQKDNAGYALRRLFCGAEGTLGIVTRAILRLVPAPSQRVTALLALPDLRATVAMGRRLRTTLGEFLTGMEFFAETGLALALRHVPGLVWPLATRAGAYLLVEAESLSPRIPLDELLGDTLADAIAAEEVLDGAIAASEAQRAAFWRLREEQPEGQRLEGPQLKHDISVPPARIADYVAQGQTLCDAILPGTRVNPFGHLADGNIHFNLSPPETTGFQGLDAALGQALARLANDMGGSFAAEHGLGRSKIALAAGLRPQIERQIMAALKAALDPAHILNPGVILSGD